MSGTTTDHLMRDKITHYTNKTMRDFTQSNVKPRKSNDRYAQFTQIHFTAGDVEQFNRYREPIKKTSGTRPEGTVLRAEGTVLRAEGTLVGFCADVNSNVHDVFTGNISRPVITDTFKYLFFKFKKGIYVKIRKGKLVTFLPFSNACFVNEYSDKLFNKNGHMKLFRRISESDGYRFSSKNVNGFVERWYANNCLLRYEYPIAENDTNIPAIRDFLDVLTTERQIPDCDFFINKRDYPVLAEGKYEPYNHIYDSKTHPLVSHSYDTYAPIFSFCAAKRHSDIIMPAVDDWIRVASSESRFYQRSGNDYYPFPQEVEWEDKKDVAIWRGSSTGAGTTTKTNKRLKLCKLAETLMLTGSNVSIDAGITAWKRRPRKLEGFPGLQTIDVQSLQLNLVDKIPFHKHVQYKYVIHVEGHVAAYRLGAELGLGSVVIIVEGEFKLWFQRFLKDGVHYVGVKQDLSNLVEKIEWLQRNDSHAKKIAREGKNFFEKYLCKNGILDYMQNTLVELTKKTSIDAWADGMPLSTPLTPPSIDLTRVQVVRVIKESKKSTVSEAILMNKRVAVKQTIDGNLSRECEMGIKIINSISGTGFVKTYGIDHDKTSLITEYVPGITFLEWMQSDNFSIHGMINTLYRVISTLARVQEDNKFVHNDLSLGNIILKNELCEEPVLIDFERSRGVLDSGQLIYCTEDDMQFSDTQDVWHLIMSTIFHLCRLKTAMNHLRPLRILCEFVASGPLHGASGPLCGASGPLCGASGPLHGASGPLHGDVLKWAIRFTEIEGKFSRLVYKNTNRAKTTPSTALEMLSRILVVRLSSGTTCLTDVWETKTRTGRKIEMLRQSSPATCPKMASCLIDEWELSKMNDKCSSQGKQLIVRLRELSLKRLYFLHNWTVEWMNSGLYAAYRCVQGDRKMGQTIRTEYVEMVNANVSHFSRSDLHYLFFKKQSEEKIVKKYSILLEFKKIFGIINDD